MIRFATALSSLAVLAACSSRALEGPSLAPAPPAVVSSARDGGDAWRWFLDAVRTEGTLEASSVALPAGLRVDVVSGVSLPAHAESQVLAEGAPTIVPAGGGVWARDGYRSPFAIEAVWNDAKVVVEWVVSARRRGPCSIDICAVPRLLSCDGGVATLAELTIRRTIGLDDAIVIAADPSSPAVATGRLLVGAAAGRSGKLTLRVRG